MARSFLPVLTALLPLAFAGAQPQPSPPPVPPVSGAPASAPPKPPDSPRKDRDNRDKDRDRDKDRGGNNDDDGPLQRFKKKLEGMDPKEREQFKENYKRWSEMGERERKELQRRAFEEHERLKKCVDEAIAKTGLVLNADQREVFTLRYRQERRKIEETLRKEIDAQRDQKVADMLARLKAEFSAQAPTATATPPPAP